jgi:deoxyribodipyrimidine photo-lyase
MKEDVSICWFRRDLRLYDQAALYHAVNGSHPVIALFIFDTTILDLLEDKVDKRVAFIYEQLSKINNELKKSGSSLYVYNGTPLNAFKDLSKEFSIKEVFTNNDYEPYAISRDAEIKSFLQSQGIHFFSYKDQVIFERDEVLKPDGKPYTIYTPYSKSWISKYLNEPVKSFEIKKLKNFYQHTSLPFPSLEKMGFKYISSGVNDFVPDIDLIRNYEATRNFPAVVGTSHVSVHLRFGTVSIREMAKLANELNTTFLKELIWREFFMMILFHFPFVINHAFKPKYDQIIWRNNEKEFEMWCRGETGYPLVDAGMRQLNETGWMHNRVRMVVASFLVKHLLIDWRWGEAYFAQKLLDYDLSANNGNWQWAAGTGCDAAPYFRVFNPEIQIKKFDSKLEYIKRWIPNFVPGYIEPIVVHTFARARALEAYKMALQNN